MHKKIFRILAIILLGIFVGNFFQKVTAPIARPIKVTGTFACLPKKATLSGILSGRKVTEECAQGLKANDGHYYGIKNSTRKPIPNTDYSIEISGIFNPEKLIGPDGNPYNIVGTIDVTSATVIPN